MEAAQHGLKREHSQLTAPAWLNETSAPRCWWAWAHGGSMGPLPTCYHIEHSHSRNPQHFTPSSHVHTLNSPVQVTFAGLFTERDGLCSRKAECLWLSHLHTLWEEQWPHCPGTDRHELILEAGKDFSRHSPSLQKCPLLFCFLRSLQSTAQLKEG